MEMRVMKRNVNEPYAKGTEEEVPTLARSGVVNACDIQPHTNVRTRDGSVYHLTKLRFENELYRSFHTSDIRLVRIGKTDEVVESPITFTIRTDDTVEVES